jgi:hypothetical protein
LADEEQDEVILEDSTASLSLEGSVRMKMEAQEAGRRKKKTWLGMSFSEDEERRTKRKNTGDRKCSLDVRDKAKPSSIVVPKVSAADKYLCADQPECKVEDDVVSEVSLDFSDLGRTIKGQRIRIKKGGKPPKGATIPETKKSKNRITTEVSEFSLDFSDVGRAIKGQRIRIKKGGEPPQSATISDVKKSKNEFTTEVETKRKESKEPAKETPTTSSSNMTSTHPPTAKKEHTECPVDKSNSKKESSADSSNKERANQATEAAQHASIARKKSTERGNRARMNQKIGQGNASINREAKFMSVEHEQDDEIITNPRFIPDLSRKELQIKSTRSPPHSFKWKCAEDASWEYSADPLRKERVEQLRKDQGRSHQYPEKRAEQWKYEEGRDPLDNDGQNYEYYYDTESDDDDCCVDRYAAGPTLPSPEVAKWRARDMAIQCHQVPKPRGAPNRRSLIEDAYYEDDDLDDYAEVNDLHFGPRYIRSSLYRAEERTPVTAGEFHL